MAQQPAVVIIARHGPRLDGADQSWHLSTPTPYDPPLTYGGWNQCRALGTRIATLLHAREQETEAANESDGVKTFDFAARPRSEGPTAETPRKRKRRKHRVVIHTSPFLRCLQTSVAIAAGMAQYAPAVEAANQQASRRKSRSGSSGGSSTGTGAAKQDLVHSLARKSAHEHQRPRRSRIRVDAFLGEWLNPQYFEEILPPPPSPMMVATAKAELMHTDSVDTFVPSSLNKHSGGSLWGSGGGSGAGGGHSGAPSALDDWSHVEKQLPVRKRDRASSQSSVGSSASGRRGHSRHGSGLTSRMPKPEFSVYSPPTPHYAVSSSDVIPRGYVAHARNACANVDYHWDSSRSPLLWGDGGEYGEEWSAMHKRFRRGLNHMVEWYSRHNSDDRSEDALGLDQAERHEEEEVEELVVVLVTHGAGCNALIGALTGQPVLLDVGMASLTVATRREDAPPITTFTSSPAPSGNRTPRQSPAPDHAADSSARRGSLDVGLSSVYEMKLVSSSEHLRPGSGTNRAPSPSTRSDLQTARDNLAKQRQRFGSAPIGTGTYSTNESPSSSSSSATPRGSMSTALGSIRRPSPKTFDSSDSPPAMAVHRSNTIAIGESFTPPASPGLWMPPASRTPTLKPQPPEQEKKALSLEPIRSLDNLDEEISPDQTVPSSSDTLPSAAAANPSDNAAAVAEAPEAAKPSTDLPLFKSTSPFPSAPTDGASDERPSTATSEEDVVGELPTPGDFIPQSLSRGLSQKGLWGARPSGDRVRRSQRDTPKRRWTINNEEQ